MGKRSWQDFIVYLVLLLLGALGLTLSPRTSDFMWDAYYYELAKSIIEGTGYGFNFKPQTMVPPGFPFVLSMLIIIIGSDYAVLVRSMTIFTTLALIAAYELLRSQEGRACAAVACILLGSSPLLFGFSTTLVLSDMPYFFTSMLLLWLLTFVDSPMRLRKRAAWWLLCGVLLLMSILMRSLGVALLGGILGWLAVSFFVEREAAKHRCKIFIPFLVIGIVGQMAWMSWAAKHQFSDWPGYGYQENYFAQLKLKNGNDPELGLANWKDVLNRPVTSADDTAAAIVGLYSRKQTASAWYSPMTLVPIFLLLLGLGNSFRKTGGGLVEWYFVSYQAIVMFYPWDFELRYLLPVAPLAFLYIWRGAALLWRLTQDNTRWVGLFGFLIAAAGGLSSVVWGRDVLQPQLRWCISIWLLVAVISILLLWGGRAALRHVSLLSERDMSIGETSVPLRRALGFIAVTCLLAVGTAMQMRIGLTNLHRAPESDPDIEAAQWIRAHSEPSTVVMARKEDLVYHYSQRKVIWFPPSSNAQMMMEGIRKYHIQNVIVANRENNYWKPSDVESFRALSEAYPNRFILIYKGMNVEVFAISS